MKEKSLIPHSCSAERLHIVQHQWGIRDYIEVVTAGLLMSGILLLPRYVADSSRLVKIT